MKMIKYTSQFKKDFKKVCQYPQFNQETLDKYVKIIQSGGKLPEESRDHPLSKASPKHYKGLRDCHISSDICLIYELRTELIVLHRIGKHNNLKLTEDI